MNPDPSDVLLTFAEVSMAFAGFASVVAIFQRRGGGAAFDRFRFWIMLEFSLASLCFALLPLALHFSGLEAERVWVLASASLALFVVGHGVAMQRLLSRGAQVVLASRTPALSVAAPIVYLGILLPQLLNAAGFGFGPGFAAYLWGLLLLLLSSAVNFVRLVWVGIPPPARG